MRRRWRTGAERAVAGGAAVTARGYGSGWTLTRFGGVPSWWPRPRRALADWTHGDEHVAGGVAAGYAVLLVVGRSRPDRPLAWLVRPCWPSVTAGCWASAGGRGQSLQRKNRRAASVATSAQAVRTEPGAGCRAGRRPGRRGGCRRARPRAAAAPPCANWSGELGAGDDHPAQAEHGDPQQVGDGEHALGAQRAAQQEGQGRERPRAEHEGDQRSGYAAQRRLPAQHRAEGADDARPARR